LVVEIELFGQLQSQVPRCQTLQIEESTTIKEVALRLGINLNFVGLMFLNGVQCEEDELITTDGRLCFFPFMSGG
jgi:hypothetical protein